MTWGIWWVSSEHSKILNVVLCETFLSKVYNVELKRRSYAVTLKGDAIFKEKLTGGLKNDIMNFVNFHVNSRKSENLNFLGLLLSVAYKVSTKKVQKSYLSWHWRVIKLWRKTNFLFEKWQREQWKSENLHFDGLLLPKVCNVWAKKLRGVVSWKTTYCFKNDIRNLVNK